MFRGSCFTQPCLEFSLHLHTTHPHFRTNFFVLSVSLSGPGSLMSASISKFKKEKKKNPKKQQQQQTLQQTPNSTFLPNETLRQAAMSSSPLLRYIHFGIAPHGSWSERGPRLKELHIKSVRLLLIESRAPFWWILWSTTALPPLLRPPSPAPPSSLGLKQWPPKTTQNDCCRGVVERGCEIV